MFVKYGDHGAFRYIFPLLMLFCLGFCFFPFISKYFGVVLSLRFRELNIILVQSESFAHMEYQLGVHMLNCFGKLTPEIIQVKEKYYDSKMLSRNGSN